MELGHQARGRELTDDITIGVDATPLEAEDLGGGDDLTFHTLQLIDADQAAPAILLTLQLQEQETKK